MSDEELWDEYSAIGKSIFVPPTNYLQIFDLLSWDVDIVMHFVMNKIFISSLGLKSSLQNIADELQYNAVGAVDNPMDPVDNAMGPVE